jgi:uncharacterized protein (TIGR02117 family)
VGFTGAFYDNFSSRFAIQEVISGRIKQDFKMKTCFAALSREVSLKKFRSRSGFLLVVIVFFIACLGPKENLYPPPADQPAKTIHVINLGWHSGIIFQREEVNDSVWPAIGDFPQAEFIEVGWGDADFYQAEETNLWLGAKALFWPTASVLHVVGLDRPPQEYFRGYQIIKIALSDSGYNRLCAFVQNSYAENERSEIIPLGRGLYGESRFYQAKGKYTFANTCNTWIAKALRAAGCPVTPVYGCTAGNVFYQMRKFGQEIEN